MKLARMALLLASGLSACAVNRTPQELRADGPSREEVFAMDYQSLAFCLENHGSPILIDMQRSSVPSVYGDLGVVEINTGYSLFELRRLDKDHTLARSFDGFIHRSAHQEWFAVLNACASGALTNPR